MTVQATTHGKRAFEGTTGQAKSKKLKMPEEETLCKLVNVVLLGNTQEMLLNRAFMNPDDLKKIFRLDDIERAPGHSRYVEIANRIYAVFQASWLDPGRIAMNELQFSEVCEKYSVLPITKGNNVVVSPFYKAANKTGRISNLLLEIEVNTEMYGANLSKISMDVDALRVAVINQLTDKVLAPNQEFYITAPNGYFIVGVNEMEFKGSKRKPGSLPPVYGVIDNRTIIHFKNLKEAQLAILDTFVDDPNVKFWVTLHILNAEADYQPVFNYDHLVDAIKKSMHRKSFTTSQKQMIRYQGYDIEIKVRKINYRDSNLNRVQKHPKTNYSKSYFFPATAKLEVEYAASEMILTKANSLEASKMVLEITKMTDLSDDFKLYKNNTYTIGVDTFISAMKTIPQFITHQKKSHDFGQYILDYRTKRVFAADPLYTKPNNTWKQAWFQTDQTQFEVKSADKSIVLLDNEIVHPVTKVVIRLTSFIRTELNLDENELREIAGKKLKKPFIEGYGFSMETRERAKISAIVSKVDFKDISNAGIKYALRGEINEKTIIKFISDLANISIASEPYYDDDKPLFYYHG